ncbi:Antimicrobial peptide Alo-3 [Pseudolycoriella hygida]|uniref:Antimicrobial peptide Alo-3 n=1 Tax=Pseudolycoriella hygida TaxID=35572 RepID=A0A9Q0NHM0_9DIPT|nr:Antimicrobial peptide Alo-3 [Pseudolycoriella hygida]
MNEHGDSGGGGRTHVQAHCFLSGRREFNSVLRDFKTIIVEWVSAFQVASHAGLMEVGEIVVLVIVPKMLDISTELIKAISEIKAIEVNACNTIIKMAVLHGQLNDIIDDANSSYSVQLWLSYQFSAFQVASHAGLMEVGEIVVLVIVPKMLDISTELCIPSGEPCRADGSWGNCCSGYCSQNAGYQYGACR